MEWRGQSRLRVRGRPRPARRPELLCPHEVLPRATGRLALRRRALPLLHRSYELMRRTKTLSPPSVIIPPSVSLCRLSSVPAGKWPFPTLSPRVCPWMLGPLSRWVSWCTCPVLPSRQRPSPRGCKRVGFPPQPRPATSRQEGTFEMIDIPVYRSGLQVCLPPRSLPPQQLMPLGSHGVYVRAECMSLPSCTSDMLAV
jgi:hypothetical protein